MVVDGEEIPDFMGKLRKKNTGKRNSEFDVFAKRSNCFIQRHCVVISMASLRLRVSSYFQTIKKANISKSYAILMSSAENFHTIEP
mmetsp:Transcript_23423/g.35093  ORF Transcript_23423/g.35093 Transcript_23423/m.35093 type:complete len:86 (+) Transcript_23423:220-477(+)